MTTQWFIRGPVTVMFPENPNVGDLFTFVQNDYSMFLYVYDGCRWLLTASTNRDTGPDDNKKDDSIEAYDRAMGVI